MLVFFGHRKLPLSEPTLLDDPPRQFTSKFIHYKSPNTTTLKVGGVNVRGGSVRATKNGSNLNLSRQSGSKGGPGAGSTSTGVAVLGESDVVSVGFGRAPLRPTLGVDDIGHRRALDSNSGVVGPWTTKVVSTGCDSGSRLGGNAARVEDVVRSVRGRSTTRGSNVTERGSKNTDIA